MAKGVSDTRIKVSPEMLPADEFYPAPRPKPNSFKISIPTDVPPGTYEVRSLGYFGLSTARPFIVLPKNAIEIREEGDHSELAIAMPLAIETGVFGNVDSRKIDWRPIAPHQDLPRYRMAAIGVDSLNSILFIGGSENPYNFNGMGYNGEPSEPQAGAHLFNVETMKWQKLEQKNPPTMDHRGLVAFKDGWLTIGGMLAGQKVSDGVVSYSINSECNM